MPNCTDTVFFTLEQTEILHTLEGGLVVLPERVVSAFPGIENTFPGGKEYLDEMVERHLDIETLTTVARRHRVSAITSWALLSAIGVAAGLYLDGVFHFGIYRTAWHVACWSLLYLVASFGGATISWHRACKAARELRIGLIGLSGHVRRAWWAASVCRPTTNSIIAASRILAEIEIERADNEMAPNAPPSFLIQLEEPQKTWTSLSNPSLPVRPSGSHS